MNDFVCIRLQVAEQLVGQLTTTELPQDFTPGAPGFAEGEAPYDAILASIRHGYTNYEELLWALPNRLIPVSDDAPFCPCPFLVEELDECANDQLAHDTLKWAARAKAADVYNQWLEDNK